MLWNCSKKNLTYKTQKNNLVNSKLFFIFHKILTNHKNLVNTLSFDESMAKDFCSDNELNKIITSKNKDKEFTKLWTQKESIVKLKGTTLFFDKKNILTGIKNYSIKTYQKKDYVVSICINTK